MRARKLLALTLSLAMALGLTLGCLTLTACGGGGGGDSSTSSSRVGPFVFALPFASTSAGEGFIVGLKNNAGSAAIVYVTAFRPTGLVYPGGTMAIDLASHAEVRTPLALITGAATEGGWVCVDTRDTTMLDAVTGEPTPVATSGYVTPYLHRTNSAGFLGVEESALQGITARSESVTLPITTRADAIQLINYSFTPVPGGPVTYEAVSYDVQTLDAFGVQIGAVIPLVVPASGSLAIPLSVPFDAIGSVVITPTAPAAGVEIRFMASALELGRHDYIPARYNETDTSSWAAQLDVAFDVGFGPDLGLSVHDFGVVMNNPTSTPKTVVLRQVFVLGGDPLLVTPRTYVIRPMGTVFMRTTTTDSRGLDTNAGEISFFADLFGDAFLATGHDDVSLWMQVPKEVNLSARHFDRSFASFYRVLKSIPLSNTVCISDIRIQQSLLTGLRNEVRITNPNAGELRIPIRGFTPGGTEYILEPIYVPGYSVSTWTPDGNIFREDPSDPVGIPVPFMQFLFTPPGGAFFRGRTTFRDPNELIILITPQITRAN